MKKFACTIGFDMYGDLWGGKAFFIIKAESETKARERLQEDIGGYYSSIYSWDMFEEKINMYRLFSVQYESVVNLYNWAREMAPRFIT